MSAVWGVGCTLCGLVSHLFLIVLGRFMVGIGQRQLRARFRIHADQLDPPL